VAIIGVGLSIAGRGCGLGVGVGIGVGGVVAVGAGVAVGWAVAMESGVAVGIEVETATITDGVAFMGGIACGLANQTIMPPTAMQTRSNTRAAAMASTDREDIAIYYPFAFCVL
jgi:hypothetical protein